MSRAKNFLNESAEIMNSAKRTRHLKQFVIQGNIRRPTVDTKPTLEAGVYKVQTDFSGPYFDIHEINTDELLRFEDSRYNAILEEVREFWKLKPKFERLGFTNKRGVLLHGKPGTGKSCLIKMMMEDMVEDGNVVFLATSVGALRSGLKQFREVEPTRKALVVLEEVDEMLYDLKGMSDLFDGDDQIGDVLFVATTNYIERIPPKMLREGRFDRKVEILPPPKAGRMQYLEGKLGLFEKATMIESHADLTDGFTFGQLREFLIGVYCYDKDAAKVAKRIKSGGGLDEGLIETQMGEDEMTKLIMNKFGYKNDMYESKVSPKQSQSRAARLLKGMK